MYDKPMTNFLILLYKKEHSRLDYAQKTFYLTKQSLDIIPTQKNDKKMTELGNKYQGYFALFFTDLAVVKKT